MFDRASGLGGSDVAAVLGLNPWRSPFDVYLEKTRDPAWSPAAENARMRLGKLLEPALRTAYQQDHPGSRLVAHRSGDPFAEPVWHPNHIAYAHLDGVIDPVSERYEAEDRVGIWEGKSARSDRDWRSTDGIGLVVPDYYEVQIRQYLAITGEAWCDCTVLFLDTAEIKHIRVWAAPATDEGIVEVGERWWRDHPMTNTPPAIDWTEGASRFLSTRQPDTDLLEPLVIAPAVIDELGKELALARHNGDMVAETRAGLENKIKEAMTGFARINGTGWTATWKRSKPAKSVGWEQVATAYRQALVEMREALITGDKPRITTALHLFTDEALDATLSLYETTAKAAHPFVFKVVEQEENQ